MKTMENAPTLDMLVDIAYEAVMSNTPKDRKIVFTTTTEGLELLRKKVCEEIGIEYVENKDLEPGWFIVSTEAPFITKFNPEGFKIDRNENI